MWETQSKLSLHKIFVLLNFAWRFVSSRWETRRYFPCTWNCKASPNGAGYSQETNQTEELMQLNVTSLSSLKENPWKRASAHRCLTVSRLCLIWLWTQSNSRAKLAQCAWEGTQKQTDWCQHHHQGTAGRYQAKWRHKCQSEDQTRVCLASLLLFFPFTPLFSKKS